MKDFRASSLIFIGLISLSLPANAFLHRAVAVAMNVFNGGGSQINRSTDCYYCGQDRWINNWQQGDSPVMNVTRNVTISGSTAVITFANNAAMVSNTSIKFGTGSGALPSCLNTTSTYFAIPLTSTTMEVSASSGPGAAVSGCTGGSGTVTAAFQMGRGGPNQWNAVPDAGGTYVSATTGQPTVPLPAEVTGWGRGLFTVPNGVAGVYNQSNAVFGPGGFPWWLGTTWTLSWTGQLSTVAGSPVGFSGTLGTGGSPGIVISGPVGSATSATVTYGSTTGPGNFAIVFAIDSTNAANPPRNVKYYQTKYAAQVASSDPATANVNPDWIAAYGHNGVVRWMPEMGTNFNFMTDSSQLADLTYDSFVCGAFAMSGSGSNIGLQPVPTGYNATNGPKGCVAPSVICLAQNKIGAHAHYNIPTTASFQFATDIANQFNSCMNQGLQVKYEYCNEIWNFGSAFHCFYYLNGQAWPPLNPSNPLTGPTGTPISIASITAGNPTTITCSPNCGSTIQNGYNVGISIPFSDTMGVKLNNILFGVSGCITAPCTSFTVSANTTGLSYSSGGVIYLGGAYQYGRAITSITPGNPTTVTCSPDCGGIANGLNVGVSIPATDSMANTINNVLLGAASNCTGTPCTSFTFNFNTTGMSASSSGVAYLAGGATEIGGYRSAQLMQRIHDAYGSANRSRWRGVMGGQFGNTAVLSAALQGARFYLDVEAPPGTKMTDLYDEGDVAPYYGTARTAERQSLELRSGRRRP